MRKGKRKYELEQILLNSKNNKPKHEVIKSLLAQSRLIYIGITYSIFKLGWSTITRYQQELTVEYTITTPRGKKETKFTLKYKNNDK